MGNKSSINYWLFQNNPKKFKQYGGDLAAPVVREIADKIAIKDKKLQDFT